MGCICQPSRRFAHIKPNVCDVVNK
jgi:hypothetical protein